MRSADEILAMILEAMARIYERPALYASGPDGLNDVLWHLHTLWLEGMGFGMDHLPRAFAQVVDAEALQAMDLPTYYRSLGGPVDDAEVTRYVVRMWEEVDEKLGIEPRSTAVEGTRP